MTWEIYLPLLGFAAVTLVTPGPNNLMLMASGTNFGLRRSLPHLLGISIGFGAMVFIVGISLVGVFERFPGLQGALKLVAGVYLLYLAWKIAHAAAPRAHEAAATGAAGTVGGAAGKPFSFLQAVAFQWVNPKGWSMALSAVAAFAPDRAALSVAIIGATFGVVNLPSAVMWTLLGREIRRFLNDPRRLRAFNWTMAGLLVATLVPVFLT